MLQQADAAASLGCAVLLLGQMIAAPRLLADGTTVAGYCDATPSEAQLSRRSWRWQGRMALAGPHAMSLEGRRLRLRRRSGSGVRDAGADRRGSRGRRCRR